MADQLAVSLLGRPAEAPVPWYRCGAVWGGVSNLAMTTIGTVVLSLPSAVATLGWAPALGLLVLNAILADLSMLFLVRASNWVKAKGEHAGPLDYESLGRILLGPGWALLIRVTLLLLLVGALTSVNVIVVDMVQSNLVNFGLPKTWYTSRDFISLMNILLMWPLTLMKDLSQLSHISFLAFASIAYVSVATMATCLSDPALSSNAEEAAAFTLGDRGFLALPVFALAFCAQMCSQAPAARLLKGPFPSTAVAFLVVALTLGTINGSALVPQFQVLPVQQSLPAASQKHMETIIHISILCIALPIYVGFGLLPYFTLGPSVSSDFLFSGWSGNPFMTAARICMAVMNMLKYPLIAMPLRDVIMELLWKQTTASTASVTIIGRMLVMSGINATIFLVTMCAAGLGWVTDMTGSGSGSVIMFMFPSLLFLAIKEAPSVDPVAAALLPADDSARTATTSCSTVALRLAATGLAPLGVMLGVVGLAFSLLLPPL